MSKITGLPLHVLDKIQYRSGGESVALEVYNRDGYGSLDSLWPRLKATDTLIYIAIDLKKFEIWALDRR
jgi:hypothetical protein